MVRLARIATCCLNQWAMDFESNRHRILESLKKCELEGARYRLGPELEVTGYGCEDHFLELDTVLHSYEVLAWLLEQTPDMDMLYSIGMPFKHHRVLYNCQVFVLHGKILLIRPKLQLAQNENYREGRWFTAWSRQRTIETCYLPAILQKYGSRDGSVPIGDAILQLDGSTLGIEICEEMWAASSTNVSMWLNGADIVANCSGSHHALRKLNARYRHIRDASARCGGVYMYTNFHGCDGGRLYFDGAAMIAMNGEVITQAKQFSLEEVEIITATLDLDEGSSFPQSTRSSYVQADAAPRHPVIKVDFSLTPELPANRTVSMPTSPFFLSPEEEIARGPALWLWDYLRRSNQGGFFLPLSGGVDSASVACIVGSMCRLLYQHISKGAGDARPLEDLRRLVKEADFVPTSPQDIACRLFQTCYMATKNSSSETQERAECLARLIGSRHAVVNIDGIVQALLNVVTESCGKQPQFKVNGGSTREDLALQNMQARSRMVTGYALAQLMPWSRGSSSTMLVLGSANVDEALRGYFTKYDCSAADINPIGGISKNDLRLFLAYCVREFNFGEALSPILTAPPTAELQPLTDSSGAARAQTDEEDMGMSYDELSIFGRLRKMEMCGPVGMFRKLVPLWTRERGLSLESIAQKVQYFFTQYAINRHKMTTLTPACHADNYSPDDNRFDLRQFLYNVRWPFQFAAMKRAQHELEPQFSNAASSGGHDECEPAKKRTRN